MQLDKPRRFAANIHLLLIFILLIGVLPDLYGVFRAVTSDANNMGGLSVYALLFPFILLGLAYAHHLARKDLLNNPTGNRTLSLVLGVLMFFTSGLIGAALGVVLIISIWYCWKAGVMYENQQAKKQQAEQQAQDAEPESGSEQQQKQEQEQSDPGQEKPER